MLPRNDRIMNVHRLSSAIGIQTELQKIIHLAAFSIWIGLVLHASVLRATNSLEICKWDKKKSNVRLLSFPIF